ncbi:hypothetical protein H6F93_22355 [Leptolyngbya sp. FACHB-671]|uniref:hypothetical protein n=1 Tax=Leptolyngbya sp. FACHB-671 TaxID=2692812 RepID=UPI001689E8DD|nr:hypothetical protein [Leptolyngbya sp. FACHB-671]MBD2070221.1 hypothetical protein [Leptolyngbya sp. FACHB-671]
MPYFKYRGKRKYEYELANGQFNPENLDPDLRQVFGVLRELGVKVIYCRYNGGGDEGFAQFSGVKLEDRIIEFDDLKYQLAEGSLGSQTSQYLRNYYRYLGEPSREQRVEFFLDLLADSLAICLLGQYYGTGEYSMKGSFRANLETGEIIDEQRQ